jgi:glycosyltransferase involved in cell wall biosynthesis
MTDTSISIITVVFNGKNLLPGTIESVQKQTWPHIEYLIIDGGSTDGTLDIIRSYAEKMPNLQWTSGSDKGLYDAMNKGLRMATGDFVQFLNCGDWLHAPVTIEKIMQAATPETDVLYGETMLVDDNRQAAGLMSALSTRKLPAALHWSQYLEGMLVVHQSFIPRRTLAPEYIAGNLCADYDWCIKILQHSKHTKNTGILVTDYLMGGMSKKRHQQSLKDRFEVMRTHFGLFPTLLAHSWFFIRAAKHRIKRWGQTKY